MSVTPLLVCIDRAICTALEEDLAYGDLTSALLIPSTLSARATIHAKEQMVVAGVAVAKKVFHAVDPSLTFTNQVEDGTLVDSSSVLLTISGKALSLLQAERVALNFLQHLSGISTLTRRFSEAVRNYPVTIVDTRKTTPGLRALEKWAVRLGGGHNHRFSLHDGILIKDNHRIILAAQNMNLTQICLLARENAPHGLRICVEVETLAHVRQALKGKADVLLLDNMPPAQVRDAISLIQNQALVEVSGGINLNNIQAMAQANPTFISIGALTHSAPSVDLSMDLVSSKKNHLARRKTSA